MLSGVFATLLLPPVVAVLAAGLLVPMLDEQFDRNGDSPVHRNKVNFGLTLIAIAVVGHVVAVVVGVGILLLVDTPIRVLLYWGGVHPFSYPLFVLAWPIWVIATGALVAWTGPALVVAGLITGMSFRESLRYALLKVTRAPRMVAVIAFLHLTVGIYVGIAFGLGYAFGFERESALTVWAATTALCALLVPIPFTSLVAAHLGTVWRVRSGEVSPQLSPITDETEASRIEIPVFGIAVAVLLVMSLATVAGAVRMAELRPMESTESLSDESSEPYHTALNNTVTRSHSVTLVTEGRQIDGPVFASYADQEDRQYMMLARPDNPSRTVYVSPGTGAIDGAVLFQGRAWLSVESFARAVFASKSRSNEFQIQSPGAPHPALTKGFEYGGEFPRPDRDIDWQRVETEDEIILETTDPYEIYLLFADNEPDHYASFNESWARATIDPETETLTSLEYHFEGVGDDNQTSTIHSRWEFEIGTDVDRPDELGSPGLRERTWDLLIY